MLDFTRLSRAALEDMALCGRTILACHERLAATGATMLDAAMRGGSPGEWQHFPAGDVYDPESHAQYFYHAHPPAERTAGEHGHFHGFLLGRGMPLGIRPLVLPELAIADTPDAPSDPLVPSAPQGAAGEDGEPWSHLVAISLAPSGWPSRLFTTNRWVTGETWYGAAEVAAMLSCFAIRKAEPRGLVDEWITAMVGLFKPQIVELLKARDAAIMGWRRRRRGKVHVFEDRRLEIAAELEISVEAQLARIEAALKAVA